MTKRYYRSIYDELNDMRRYLDILFQQIEEPLGTAMLPAAGELPKMLPLMRGELRVDMSENETELIVIVDLIEGIAKRDITIDLIDPQLLEISGKRTEERIEDKSGFYAFESRVGSMTRVITLPTPVKEEGSMALFKNGALEIHLIKETRKPSTRIIIM